MTQKEIYAILSKLVKTEDIEKKNNLDYVSWAVAYSYLIKSGLNFHYNMNDYELKALPDASVLVSTKLTIEDITITCTLPVMDYKNQAIKNPNACDINKNIQRCFVKNCALFGLGLSLYSGEDLPEEPKEEAPKSKFEKMPTKFKYAEPKIEPDTRIKSITSDMEIFNLDE